MQVLTGKQEAVYDFIVQFFKRTLRCPTYREIGEEFDMSVRASWDHVIALEKKGYVDRDRNGITLKKEYFTVVEKHEQKKAKANGSVS